MLEFLEAFWLVIFISGLAILTKTALPGFLFMLVTGGVYYFSIRFYFFQKNSEEVNNKTKDIDNQE